ncbi:MAG: class I SAM-dependent methyltransferase [Chromatiales bacterium]
MRRHLKGIVDEVVGVFGREPERVLDIGCNDGTLLSFYGPKLDKYGVDPSDIAQEIGDDVTVIQDVFPSGELKARLSGNRCDIITSIAMFYDLEDPIGFVDAIKSILCPDGIWVFEMSYMPTMLSMNSYDTICHEHLEYYSLAVIEFILRQAKLKVFNVSLNEINGGSIRCFATHEENYSFRREDFMRTVKQLRQTEFDLALDTDKPFKNFQDRINVHKDQLNSLLKKLRKDGKRIHVYGASTKGNTILQWCGIDSRIIDVAAERNPDKYGAHTLGTDIMIVSEEESRAMKPDYYLVLPWHFKDEFLEREAETLRKGTQFIFPLPEIQIVGGT